MYKRTAHKNLGCNITIIIITVIIALVIAANAKIALAEVQQTFAITSLSDVSLLAQSSKWSDRMRAASKILAIANFDTALAVNILIEGISAETKTPAVPTLSDIRGGASSNGWNDIIPAYIFDLSSLGKSILPRVKEYSIAANGELKSWLLISRGLLSDSTVHDDLVKLLADKNPNIRALAVKSLSRVSNPNDFEHFKNALSDLFNLTSRSDISIDDGNSLANQVIFPIRLEAINALIFLGYKVLPDSSGKYIIEKK